MADFIDDPAERLAVLLRSQEKRLADIFTTAIRDLRDEIDLNELADLIERGQINEALDKLKHAAERIGAGSNIVFVTSGQDTAQFLSNAGIGRVVFDQVNVWAVAQMQTQRLTMIQQFTDEQRKATSLALISGVESGINPVAQARNFRDSIGLTEKQWSAVQSYRDSLERVGSGGGTYDVLNRALRDGRGDAQILRAARDGLPLPQEKIDWLVRRYSERFVIHRSKVIARTEALSAVNAGNEAMYRQAIEAGTLRPEMIERTWVTRLDGRERLSHELLNGQKRKWGQVWETIHGVLRFPGDPDAVAEERIMCRCTLATRIKTR